MRTLTKPVTRRHVLAGSAGLLSGAVSWSSTDTGILAQEASPTPASTGLPPEVEEHMADWPLPNRDYANTRATSDSNIASDTIQALGAAWSFSEIETGPYGAFASNPIVTGQVVYLQDLRSNIFALDLESGEALWEQRYGNAVVGPNGPAIGWGKLFATVNARDVAALDLETGRSCGELSSMLPPVRSSLRSSAVMSS
jgi:glucose dehydrogenase